MKTQRTITLRSAEANYEALLECAQEMNFVNMLLQEITEFWKPEIMQEDNQGAIFLAKNRQVGMSTKHTNIRHHFMREIVEGRICISIILKIKLNSVEIMTKKMFQSELRQTYQDNLGRRTLGACGNWKGECQE